MAQGLRTCPHCGGAFKKKNGDVCPACGRNRMERRRYKTPPPDSVFIAAATLFQLTPPPEED